MARPPAKVPGDGGGRSPNEQWQRDLAALEALAAKMRAEIKAEQQRLEGVELAITIFKGGRR